MGFMGQEIPVRIEPMFEVNTLGSLEASVSSEKGTIGRADENLIRQLLEAMDSKLLAVISCRIAKEFRAKRAPGCE
jgi:predicted negative regulator of RcsB-dependent stress response